MELLSTGIEFVQDRSYVIRLTDELGRVFKLDLVLESEPEKEEVS